MRTPVPLLVSCIVASDEEEAALFLPMFCSAGTNESLVGCAGPGLSRTFATLALLRRAD
jgi:hypothetical protein